MGSPHRLRGERRPDAEPHRLAELTIMRHPARRAGLAAAAATLAASVISLHASSPKFFQAATQLEFLKGDIENLSVDNRGRLTLGPATELVYETAAPFLWAIAPAPDGSL